MTSDTNYYDMDVFFFLLIVRIVTNGKHKREQTATNDNGKRQDRIQSTKDTQDKNTIRKQLIIMWRLSRMELFLFALGTVLMDLTSTCWFTYLLIYLEDALYFDPGDAGIVLLVGQIADAIATPLVGY